MNLVQSCWFKNHEKLESGWLSTKYNLMSWALSAQSYNKFYKNIGLITDNISAEILIDKLALPYNNISLAQEHYKTEFESLWVLRKLYSYSIQNESFIHTDGDTYLFKPFDNEILNASIVGQNMEYDHPCYVAGYAEVVEKCKYLPKYIKKDADNSLSAVNAGIMGGNNFTFFKYLFVEVNEFVNQNRRVIPSMDSFTFNIFLEQFIFKKLADEKGLKIAYQVKEPIGYPYVYNLFGFTDLPSKTPYIHIMNYKQNPTICEQMAQRLNIDSPELYERVIKVAKELEATKVFVESPKKSIIEKYFYRTAIIANHLGLPLPKTPNDSALVATLNNWLTNLPDTNENTILADVLNFEIEKYNYTKNFPLSIEFTKYRQEQSVIVNNMLQLPVIEVLTKNITFGKYITSIESEWKWAEINEFTGQDVSVNYLDNLGIEAGYFQILLFCYPVSMVIKEQLLDTLSILIVDALQQMEDNKLSINKLVDNVVGEIIEINPDNEVNILKNSIIDKIRYMLYQGILSFID